ncbi:DUF7144 family membrane protein [Streptomyces longispororuber]|uniref:DUF7144 family membrane protein n=1 Tax=Streptomyces longispororuber TaxID=68230 RepID=UPI002109DE12|nr:hypothetical protein [Streptomyces longispororuber]MCQ4208366.1 hypothetical protein [Streptomyces longispororuber]
MSESSAGRLQGSTGDHKDAPVTGVPMFAGLALELSGSLSVLMGIAGIAGDNLFHASQYAYRFNLTTWGWAHLVIGLALIVTGLAVLLGKSWSRGAGLVLGAVSLITQFLFVPYYPLWSISVMVLDLLAVWALTRSGTFASR